MFRKTFVILIMVLAAAGFCSNVQAYTKPGNPSGFVNDFANVLTADQRGQLENKLSNFEKETSEEIAVAIIPTVGNDETIETYAVRLFEDWKIGKADRDTGVLFLVALQDRKMRIEVGYGLEGDLTDIQSRDILDNIVAPEFKSGNYFVGIDKGTDQIITELRNGEEVQRVPVSKNKKSSGLSGDAIGFLFWLGLILLSTIGRKFSQTKSWYAGGILGAIIGGIIGLFKGFIFTGIIWAAILIPLGLLFDFIMSRRGPRPPGSPGLWWGGGGFGGRSGGGFGGFGGGSSGGGGSSSSW